MLNIYIYIYKIVTAGIYIHSYPTVAMEVVASLDEDGDGLMVHSPLQSLLIAVRHEGFAADLHNWRLFLHPNMYVYNHIYVCI